jgi:tetratricopeptide (TPR) repeat protein
MLITSAFVKAQSIEQTYAFANDMLSKQRFSEAVETYKRVLFFDKDQSYGPKVYRNIADCLYETGSFEEAAFYYDLAFFSTRDELIQNEITLRKTSCFLVMGQYNLAQAELYNLPAVLTKDQEDLKTFYEAMLAFALDDFRQSEKLFKEIASDTLVVHSLFRENDKVSKINPKTAKVLSIIFPGAGQFYAGDIKNGLNSMLLTGGLFYLGIRSALNASLLDATISVLPWFQRYYMGGFKKAALIAESKIKERRHQIFNELLDEVE